MRCIRNRRQTNTTGDSGCRTTQVHRDIRNERRHSDSPGAVAAGGVVLVSCSRLPYRLWTARVPPRLQGMESGVLEAASEDVLVFSRPSSGRCSTLSRDKGSDSLRGVFQSEHPAAAFTNQLVHILSKLRRLTVYLHADDNLLPKDCLLPLTNLINLESLKVTHFGTFVDIYNHLLSVLDRFPALTAIDLYTRSWPDIEPLKGLKTIQSITGDCLLLNKRGQLLFPDLADLTKMQLALGKEQSYTISELLEVSTAVRIRLMDMCIRWRCVTLPPFSHWILSLVCLTTGIWTISGTQSNAFGHCNRFHSLLLPLWMYQRR